MQFPFPLLAAHNSYRAGQYAFVCVPELSLLEWHPISISSAPHSPVATMHVKVSGDWTKRLHQLAGEQAGGKRLKVFVDGPYGEPMIDVESDRYTRGAKGGGGWRHMCAAGARECRYNNTVSY